jgi:endogenous inhibitor of DNA gyrase (YacG/DUF329 family)
MSDTAKESPSNKAISMLKCPTCGATADPQARPFCSPRCADIDLGQWLQGKYAIPAVDAADDTIVEALMVGDNSAMHDDNC